MPRAHPASSTDDAPTGPVPAWARRCGRCGYDLHATPTVPACPECGEPCDAESVVIVGRRAVGAPSLVILAVSSQMLVQRVVRGDVTISIVLFAVVVAIVAMHVRNRRRYGSSGNALLLFDARGVAQRRDYGPLRVVPWSRIRTVKFRPVHRWRWSRTRPIPPSWSLAFGTGPLADPWTRGGYAGPGRTFVVPTGHVIFDAPEAEARAIEAAAYRQFRRSRPPSDAPTDRAGSARA